MVDLVDDDIKAVIITVPYVQKPEGIDYIKYKHKIYKISRSN